MGQSKKLIHSLLFLITGYAVATTVISVLNNAIIEEYALQDVHQGMVSSMIQVGSMVALVLALLLQGRVKKTRILSFSILLQVAMLLATGLASHYILLLIACSLLGLGGAWTDTYANSSMVDLSADGDSPKNVGALHGWYAVGALITPLVISGLLLVMSWRMTYLVLAALVLAMVLPFVLLVGKHQSSREEDASLEESRLSPRQMASFFGSGINLLIVFCFIMHVVGQNGFNVWMVRYMAVRFDAEALGMTGITLYWICAAVSRFVAPRLPATPFQILAGGSILAGLAMVVGVASGNAMVMWVMVGANGLFSGCGMPLMFQSAAARYTGSTSLPTTILLLIGKGAAVAVPLILAAVASRVSMAASMLIPGLGLVLCGLAAGLAILLYGKHLTGKKARA